MARQPGQPIILPQHGPEQVLRINPADELRFEGPFNESVVSEVKLRNPTNRKVCFKVKTTEPHQYCVRPINGILEPGQKEIVSVRLQPFDFNPNVHYKHKFMIQALYAPEGRPVHSVDALWREADPNHFMNSKLRCVFYIPGVTFDPPPSELNEDDREKHDEEMRKLQDENQTLKSEVVRLRKMLMQSTVNSTPPMSQRLPEPQPCVSVFPPIMYFLMALVLGMIVGKLYPACFAAVSTSAMNENAPGAGGNVGKDGGDW